jgi:class 3 adenylate cyclase
VPRVQVRIGTAAGEPIERGDDLFGTTVQLAARLCAHADPGTILVSQAVAELCLGKNMRFTVTEDAELKGFSQPVHTCRVELTA